MIKNSKGFMLAEVVITSTVVMTAMIGLYATFTKIYNAYNIRTTYYNIDGVYASKKVADYLITTDNDNNINKLLLENENKNYIKISTDIDDTINALANAYSVSGVYVVKFTSNAVDELKNTNINETFKDYLGYLKKYYSFPQVYDDTFLVILEYGEDNNLQYSNIKVG